MQSWTEEERKLAIKRILEAIECASSVRWDNERLPLQRLAETARFIQVRSPAWLNQNIEQVRHDLDYAWVVIEKDSGYK